MSRRITALVGLLLLTQQLSNAPPLRLEFRHAQAESAPVATQSPAASATRVVAENLHVPWAMAFLPNGEILATERPGVLHNLSTKRSYKIEGVTTVLDSGLLGIAIHPDFERNRFVYLFSTYTKDGKLHNRVVRYTLAGNLTANLTIIEGIPSGSYHDGGALGFGPDRKLYVTTGDGGDTRTSQDLASLAGKILRLEDDGRIPKDNPFGTAVYSYGHRNPQGIAWDDQGRMWATEHGHTRRDEINLIVAGGNYGWPVISGDEKRDGMLSPIAHSGSDTTWAPSGIAYNGGALYFGGLAGTSVYRAGITGDAGSPKLAISRHYAGVFGRIRAAAIKDNTLYLATSNRDGRYRLQPNDDKVLAIALDRF